MLLLFSLFSSIVYAIVCSLCLFDAIRNKHWLFAGLFGVLMLGLVGLVMVIIFGKYRVS